MSHHIPNEIDADPAPDMYDVCQNIRDQLQTLLANVTSETRAELMTELGDIEDVLSEIMSDLEDSVDEDESMSISGPTILPENDEEGVEDDDNGDEDWG